MRATSHWICAAGLLAAGLNDAALAAAPVLQRGYDAGVTGANLAETQLNTATVGPDTFGKLFTLALDENPYAQPLYVPNVAIPGLGTHNVLYVATMNDSVYAFDADTGGAPLWHVNLASLFSATAVPWGDAVVPPALPPPGNLGILSTPVIDAATDILYVVACTLEAGAMHYRLHALDIRTGAEPYGPGVLIGASYQGRSFETRYLTQRVSLALAGNLVIFGFGGMVEEAAGNYNGWILAYDKLTLQQRGAFATTTTTTGGGVWQSGRPAAVDAAGNAYLFSGNGFGNGYDGAGNFAESALKFATSGKSLSLVDWFTAGNWALLDKYDLDLTSSGPMLIPGTALLAGGGKTGDLYLLDTANLGKFNPSDSQVVQKENISDGQKIMGGPVYWNRSAANGGPLLFDWASGDVLKAYAFDGSEMSDSPTDAGMTSAVFPGGALAISADGSEHGSGLLWATTNNQNPLQGILHVYDAEDLSDELWNSTMTPSRDAFGNFAKFVPPTVVNGKVYVASFAKQIAAYGTGVAAPAFRLSPLNLSFGDQQTTTTSAPRAVTMTNAGNVAVPLVSVRFLGANAAYFSQTNDCGTSLAPGASCTFNVRFGPAAAGAQSVWMYVNGSARLGTRAVALTGTGIAPFTLAPASLAFGAVQAGTNSAPQAATVTNTGVAALPIGAIGFAGANAAQFRQTNNCGAALAVGASCTINVVFAPTRIGGPTATLDVNGGPGVIRTIAVSGSGYEPFTLSPASLTFGSVPVNSSSAPQAVTVANSGALTLPVSGIVISGSGGSAFSQTTNCGSSLAAGSGCTVNVVFSPVTKGPQAAKLTVSGPGVAHSVTLSGSGQ